MVGLIPRELNKFISLEHEQQSFLRNHALEFGDLSSLKVLDLSNNYLNGEIPVELEKCLDMSSLKLSNNNLSGSIPYQLGNLNLHEVLDLSCNSLTGVMPSQLGKLTELQELNLSHNELVGCIPSSFQYISSLASMDLSYNLLNGPIPENQFLNEAPTSWFINNKGLCGQLNGLPPCQSPPASKDDSRKHTRNIILVVIPIACTLFLSCLMAAVIILYYKRKKFQIHEASDMVYGGTIFSIWNFNGKEAYSKIIEATENFDEKYCIGAGAYGTVYRVKLSSEETFAVKKIQKIEYQVDERAFKNEIQALTQIRHRNIVRLYGFVSTNEFNFLAYEYIERGSLSVMLKSEDEAMELDW